MHKVLIVAANDPLGYAGLQADFRACYAAKVMPFGVVSATTAQNNKAVFAVDCVKPENLRKQFESVLTDYRIDALKIGLLADYRFFEIIAEVIRKYKIQNVVLDPVMSASSEASLLKNSTRAYRQKYQKALIGFLAQVDFLTPNYNEALQLLSLEENPSATPEILLKEIKSLGVKNVILKGGHVKRNDDFIVDYFIDSSEKIFTLKHKKFSTSNSRGSGCSFASGLAAFLAKGLNSNEAFLAANKQVIQGFQNSLEKNYDGQKGPIWLLPQ